MTLSKTYSLSLSSYTSNFNNAMEDETANANGDATLAAQAFTAWSNLVNFSFQSASPSTSSLNIVEGILPATAYGRSSQLYTEGGVQKQGIVISNTITYGATTKAFTYLHEIGHGIGLGHIPADRSLSIMADGDAPNASGKPLPTGPMILDIKALHTLYPAEINYSYKNGNDSYGDGTSKTWTIWDGGGVSDTITAASQSTTATIDLRGGMNAANTDAYWSHIGSEWIAIAYDPNHFSGVVTIERALGGSAGDSIYGGGINNPELRGNGGNDTIWGDGDKGVGMFFGGDTIYGDTGSDTLYGDNGQNTLAGSSATVGGADVMYGGADNDKIYGEGANDTLYGEAGLDTLYGGQGVDSISGGADSDKIYGGLGGDHLYGDGGNDTIYAYDSVNGGNDTSVNYLYGGDGDDLLVSGGGADVFDSGLGNDTINYGAGNDTIDVSEFVHSYLTEDFDQVNGGTGLDVFQFNNIAQPPTDGLNSGAMYFEDGSALGLADDDNHFSVYINTTGMELEYLDSNPSDGIRAGQTVFGPWHGELLEIRSVGDDLIVTSWSSSGEYPSIPRFSAHIGDVGKDLSYGSDLLTYLSNNGMIDISQLLNGNFTVNVGHSIAGTSAAEEIKVNANINDVTGNGGGDRFIATNQSYGATIQDFSTGQGDKIDLTAFDGQLATYSQLGITGSTSAVVTLTNGSTLTLNGVAASSVAVTDFLSNTMYYGAGGVSYGDSGNNSITGSVGDDVIYCEVGSDTANGGMGSDTIYGWTESDMLFGGYGQDVIGGDAGNDTIQGNSGLDSLFGGDGADSITGGDGADLLGGDAANDILYGENGNDTLDGGTGNDSMYGGGGDDTYYVDSASDVVTESVTLDNGAFNDSIDTVVSTISYTLNDTWVENVTLLGTAALNAIGDYSNNVLTGNTGNNGLTGGDGADTIDGGGGIDTCDYSSNTVAISINLTTNLNTGGKAAGDVITNVEQIVGTAYADYIHGHSGYDYMVGGLGNDTLIGADGNDAFSAGAGADSINGGNGVDSLDYYYSSGAVWIDFFTFTGAGADAQGDTYANIEIAYGSNTGNDTIVGYTSNDGLYGMGGNDYLYGHLGNDTIDGGAGNDTFLFSGNHGVDTVLNFEGEGVAGGDAIELHQTAYGSFAALQSHITYNSGASTAQIDLGSGHTITLTGITASFAASDFYFS